MSTPQLMNNHGPKRAIDEPLIRPDSDLLEMDQHAKALAVYIRQIKKLPFTVGIFGEWGEGKTTMVNFLKFHLTPAPIDGSASPFNFVSFSAWPYTTSEKLWRALILEIAKVLYGVKEDSPAQESEAESTESMNGSSGLMRKVTDFLTGDFFREKKKARERTAFEKLVEELDGTDYGKITKRTPNAELNQEAVISAVVNGALGVLGTVSPLAAGLRSFFGLEPKIDTEKLTQSDAEDSSTKAVEALPNFQKIFRRMVAEREGEDPVYVFIDDLDRAQPDVALDIMESVRIALSEGDCVFIIAVDERLIAQGLRLRYRDLFAREKTLAIETKGREYLEKIIQFRTRVPPRTAEQAQRLIAAEFPHWTPAGDIIQSIVGNNPRRIKQYCQRLSFQNMIGSTTFTLGSAPAETSVTPTGPPGSSGQNGPDTLNLGSRPPGIGPPEILELSHRLNTEFEEQELRDLFLIMQLNYAEMSGEKPSDKITSLLTNMANAGKLDDVRNAVLALKPDIFRTPPMS